MSAIEREMQILQSKCKFVDSQEEADIIVNVLENNLENYTMLSAPEMDIGKSVAIIRTHKFSLNLINPVVLEKKEKRVMYNERCASFPHSSLNCFRHNHIVIETGIGMLRKIVELNGDEAAMVEHCIDHLNGVLFIERVIIASVVRPYGQIKSGDYCPCGSKGRFEECCINL